MPPRFNYKSDRGSSRWITISLIALLIASAAFVGFAIYFTQFNGEKLKKLTGINGASVPPAPEFDCPLDGTKVADRAAASHRTVVVQVDNAPAARPQSGLSLADIVYEAMAEGDVTRFSAIFACREADPVGPVRSARLVNLEIVPQYNALLANSGSSQGVTAELAATPDIPNIAHPTFPDAFWRVGDRIAPHDMMTSTGAVRKVAEGAGFPVTAMLPSTLLFKDDAPSPSISTIGVPYSSIADVQYTYDAGSNGWLRNLQGEPHIDALTGKQLAPRNVIIQYVGISESSIEEDVGGNLGLIFNLTGSGRVQVFRDGQVYEGTWRRDARNSITSYLDAAGKPIPLNRGLTFIQLVPGDFQVNIG